MDGYKVFSNVYVLDEHVLNDDDGSQIAVVDRTILEQIARNNNTRKQRTGDLTPIVIGHTRDGVREAAQPEIVGWAENFRVEEFFQTGKYAIACDMWIKNTPAGSADEIADKFPRRSVELWLKRKEIDPISLLGATTPERDLGPMRRYQRSASEGIHYSREAPRMNDNDKQMSEASAQVVNSGPFKQMQEEVSSLKEQIQQLLAAFQQAMQEEGGQGGEHAEPDGDEGGHPGEDYGAMFGEGKKEEVKGEPNQADGKEEADPSDKVHRYEDDAEHYESHCEDEDEEDDDEDSKKYEYGFASPTSVSIPNVASKEKKKKMSREEIYDLDDFDLNESDLNDLLNEHEKVKYQRDDLRVKLSRMERELTTVKEDAKKKLAAKDKELGELKKKYQRAEAEAAVKQLANEGYEFDTGEIVEELLALPNEKWETRIERVRKYHRKDITKVATITPTEGEPAGVLDDLEHHEVVNGVAEIMRKEGLEFKEAKAKYQRSKNRQ